MITWTPPIIIGVSEHPADIALFEQLGIELASTVVGDQWQLTRSTSDNRVLCLQRPDGVKLSIDFTAGKARHRTTESGMGAQALTKATGVRSYYKKHGSFPTITDATGGLGQDAWALASLGCEIIVYERHPIVHALVADALERAAKDPHAALIASRITLVLTDSVSALKEQSQNAHTIYLDPMYPARRRKSSSKKGMQFLHELLGPAQQTQSPALLMAALTSGARRVIVKRPAGAELLAGSDTFTGQRTDIRSPNTRYDVYHVPLDARNSEK